MKSFIKIAVVLFSLLVTVSCEKEPIEYNGSNIVYPNDDGEPSLSLNGKWKLISGRMYLQRLDGYYTSVKFDHFGPGKTHSSMRYGGSQYRIEELYQDSTIWEFSINTNGYGTFILDGDSLAHYSLQSENSGYRRIMEDMNMNAPQKMGGSSKPFIAYINNFDEEIIDIVVNEAYTNLDGYNYRYHNVLQFKKQ